MISKLEQSRLFILIVLVCKIESIVMLSLSEFYPYGDTQGDRSLPANDDNSSGRVRLSILFPYFDKNHDSLFVSISAVLFTSLR